MKNALVNTELDLKLANSHSGEHRVFFVGDYWWQRISRPAFQHFGPQRVKQHARWYFVEMKNVDRMFIAEIPLISWLKNRREMREGQRLVGKETSDQNLLEGQRRPSLPQAQD